MIELRVHTGVNTLTGTPLPQMIDSVRAANKQLITVDQCVWGPNYLSHPSYVFMNAKCPAVVAKWPTAAAGSCPMSEWSKWSPCDVNCGSGTRY